MKLNFISFQQKLLKFLIFRNFSFLAKFWWNLSEFREELQQITNILDISSKLPEKRTEMPEISGIHEKFHSSFHNFNPLFRSGAPLSAVSLRRRAVCTCWCANCGRNSAWLLPGRLMLKGFWGPPAVPACLTKILIFCSENFREIQPPASIWDSPQFRRNSVKF